jgi:hypothetical protein
MKNRKSDLFYFIKKARAAFKELKKRFQSAPIFRLYDPKFLIRLETDISEFVIKIIISQLFLIEDNKRKKWYPITFWSRKLTNAEKNYDAHNAEFLTIMKIFKKWRYYLEEAQYMIEIVCNYQNLKYFTITKALNRR